MQNCRFIHCADNTKIDTRDKAWRTRLHMNMIKNKCFENFVPQKHITYDESMAKYFGKLRCKPFFRGELIRISYTRRYVNTINGYLVNFDLYQGKSLRKNEKYDSLIGNAVSLLFMMLEDFTWFKK